VRTLSADVLLRLWDEGGRSSPAERPLVLAAAEDDADPSDLAAQPLGRTTARLLRLRAAAVGPALAATVACPDCAQTVEFTLDTGALLALEDKAVDDPPPLLHGGYEVVWRSPTQGDLAALAGHPGVEDAETMLLDRCVLRLSREHDAASLAAAELPGPVREALARAMADADPLADVLVDLGCPECGTEFTASLDVGVFVWAEIDARARRLLLDVDALARAYGWSEAAVLALSEARRAAYLRIVTEELP